MDRNPEQTALLDKLAVLLSGICLLHCLLLPLLVAVLPFLGQFGDDHLHLEMLVVVIPVSAIALWSGFRRHRNQRVVLSGAIGLCLLTFGGTAAHEWYGLIADRLLTVTGSLILAATHYRNFRLTRCAPDSAG